jgi:AraC-like DNA-binding protein
MELVSISIPNVKKIFNVSSIEDDLVMFDSVKDLPKIGDFRRMSCLLVALCTKGQSHYTVDTVEHTVQVGDIIIVSSGQVFGEYCCTDDYEGVVLLISDSFFGEVVAGVHEISSLFIFSKIHPVFHLKQGEMENVLLYVDLLKKRLNDQANHFRRDVASSLIKALIYEVSNIIWTMHESGKTWRSRSEKIFTEFIKLVEKNFRERRRVSWYALELCITPKYLSETVKQVSGRTPNDWIDSYVTMEIRVLLKNTSKSIKEITGDLHFPNQSFLGKYFKEHVGLSPSDYRRREIMRTLDD